MLKKGGGNRGGGANRFLGCELLESRAVMGITGGDAERNLLGRTGPLRVARHIYGDHGGRERWLVKPLDTAARKEGT